MPKALCLFSLVASILVVCLFSADAAMGMAGMKSLAPLSGASMTMDLTFAALGGGHDLPELVDVPRAALGEQLVIGDVSTLGAQITQIRTCVVLGPTGMVPAVGYRRARG